MPLKDRTAPRSRQRRASSGPPREAVEHRALGHALGREDVEGLGPGLPGVDHEGQVVVRGRARSGPRTPPPAGRAASGRSGSRGRTPPPPRPPARRAAPPCPSMPSLASWGCTPTVAQTVPGAGGRSRCSRPTGRRRSPTVIRRSTPASAAAATCASAWPDPGAGGSGRRSSASPAPYRGSAGGVSRLRGRPTDARRRWRGGAPRPRHPPAARPAARGGRGWRGGRRCGRAGARAAAPAGPVTSSRPRWAVSKRLTTTIEGLGELRPLLPEAGQALEDLVARAGEAGLLDGLADHGQHREQAHRRAQHDLLPEGDVDQLRIALVDERPHALVRDEQQHLVERGVGVDVAAARQLLHPAPHVAQEGLGVQLPLGVGVASRWRR